MNELEEILNCGNEKFAAMAQILIDVQEHHKNGDLSDEEYKEILEDAAKLEVIETDANTIALSGLLLKGVSGLLKVL